ncbi:MAG TPA: four helix bundle protein [Bacteroidia bacterium]|jgi:four helix bundle protein|nr:four helix bundle protein [Bacteroidia bacterium]
MKQNNIILDLTFDFSLQIIKYTKILKENREYELSKQLFRSGTSIGANVREAQSAESRNDFIHKLRISDKEAQETEYWLLLCKRSEGYPDADELLKTIGNIKRILGKIISTSKLNNN